MGVAPNLGTKVDGGEDGSSIDPNVVENVSAEWSDKGKGMGVKVGDAGDVAEEVALDKFLLWNPKLLTSVIDDGVLVGMSVSNKGTGGGSEEIGEEVC